MRRFFSYWTMVLVLGWVPGAFADTSLIVSPMKGSQNKAATQAIEKEFQAMDGLIIIESERVEDFLQKKGLQSSQDPKSMQSAADDLAQAQKMYHQLDEQNKDLALEKATSAIEEYTRLIPQDQAFDGLIKSLFARTLILLALKKKEEASRDLEEMLTLDPKANDRTISARLYSEDVKTFFDQTKQEFLSRDKANVVITSLPSEASIWVNGQHFGKAPCSLSDLPIGHFYITMESSGKRHTEKVYLSKGENQVDLRFPQQDAQLIESYFAVSDQPTLDPQRTTFLDELGLSLGADIIVFLSAGKASVKGQLFDQRSQDLSPVVQGKDPHELVSNLLQSLDQNGYVIRASSETAPPQDIENSSPLSSNQMQNILPPSEEEKIKQNMEPSPSIRANKVRTAGRPLWKNPWVYAGIGAVVLGTGASLALFTDVFKAKSSNTQLQVTTP
ncbi:MAG: PEGA domain-containing protein [Bdellovibrionota bacterium]